MKTARGVHRPSQSAQRPLRSNVCDNRQRDCQQRDHTSCWGLDNVLGDNAPSLENHGVKRQPPLEDKPGLSPCVHSKQLERI